MWNPARLAFFSESTGMVFPGGSLPCGVFERSQVTRCLQSAGHHRGEKLPQTRLLSSIWSSDGLAPPCFFPIPRADNPGPWSVGDLSREHEAELSGRIKLSSNPASKSLKREKQLDLSGLSAFVCCLVDSWPRNKSTSYNSLSWDWEMASQMRALGEQAQAPGSGSSGPN